LNADGLVSTGQGMLSHNMFAYCANNPVVFKDPSGFAHCMSNEYGGGGGFGAAAIGGSGALADTIKGIWYGTVGTIGAIGNIGYRIITSSRESTKSKSVAIDITKDKREKPITIYRYGSSSNTNLTPRPKDTGGLSFSLMPPTSGKYVATTMQAVNATGILKAVKDGPNHVSIMPTIPSTMSSWIQSRPNAQISPHPYTIVLKSIVWDGK